MDCPDENNNEKFKDGSLSIVVTTNSLRNQINKQKLADLLPDATEYSCNSIDRVVNMPQKKCSQKFSTNNIGKTANAITFGGMFRYFSTVKCCN